MSRKPWVWVPASQTNRIQILPSSKTDRKEGNLHSQLETFCLEHSRKNSQVNLSGLHWSHLENTTVSLKVKPTCFSMHPYLTFLDHSWVSRLTEHVDSKMANMTDSQPQASISFCHFPKLFGNQNLNMHKLMANVLLLEGEMRPSGFTD